jgi:hypothetical protein
MKADHEDGEQDDMTTNDEAGVGHNLPLDSIAERAAEAMSDYETGIAKEQTGRDDAIAAIIKYGLAMAEGRALHTSNNQFGDWIKARGLDKIKPFDLRQERAAAGQIAKIAVDSTATVNPFSGCPHSRPTNIMTWWRAKQPKPAPLSQPLPKAPPAYAEPVAAQAAPKATTVAAAAPPDDDEEDDELILQIRAGKEIDPDADETYTYATATLRAGLDLKDDTGRVRITIYDRDEAVAWFEDALAAYDEAHPDVAVLATTVTYTKAQQKHIDAAIKRRVRELEKEFAERKAALESGIAVEIDRRAEAQCKVRFPHPPVEGGVIRRDRRHRRLRSPRPVDRAWTPSLRARS